MNLRQVRTKIKSINNVKKITRAMQMVSAIKMKKAQAAEIDGRPYRTGLETVINKITKAVDITQSPLLNPVKTVSKKELVILVSSNKGLCGSFHVNINRFLFKEIDFDKTDFVTMGEKAAQFVNKMGSAVIADYSEGVFLDDVSAVFQFVLTKFLSGEYFRISLVYNRFISSLRSEPVKEIVLPFQLKGDKTVKSMNEIEKSMGEYLIEPTPSEIIEPLLKNFIEEKIRGAVISSEAVEHSARMIAMKNATDNATDITYNLTLLGNKIRQSKITSELLDMITAKESVEQG